MSEWLPIETAPKDGTRILLLLGDGLRYEMAVVISRWTVVLSIPKPARTQELDEYDVHHGWESDPTNWQLISWTDECGCISQRYAPTHWQPLPLPPLRDKAE